MIPQDPVLFQGSIRFNIDPFNIATDIEVWKVLEEAYLKDKVSRLTNMLNPECSMFQEESYHHLFFQGGQRQGGAGSGYGCGGGR